MAREPRSGAGGEGRNRRDRNAPADNGPESDIVEKLVHINRVAATVKGGRRFSFAALMVVGDQKGRVGFGHGKAREVPEAIRKATEEAKKTMIRVPLRESRTLHHDGNGRWGAGKVMVRAAPPGTGVIAGGPMRAVLETLGVQDVVGKSTGSSNPYNMVRATFEALKVQSSPRQIAAKRGKKVSDVLGRRDDGASSPDALEG
jgi:small subunit ribosomal protein S5